MGSRSSLHALLVCAWCALMALPLWAQPAVEWEGHYLVYLSVEGEAPMPVGLEHRRYFPTALGGQRVQGYESSARIHLNLMGTSVTVSESALSYTTFDGDPLRLESGMGAAEGAGQQVIATYYPDRVEYVRRSGDDETSGSVEIPEGISLRDPEYLYDPAAMPTNEAATLWAFDPMSLSIQPVSMVNAGREPISVSGQPMEAWRLEIDSEAVGPTTHWVDDDGYIVRSSYFVGALELSLERVSAQRAAEFAAGEASGLEELPDLIEGTAVRPGLRIPNPRACAELTVRVTGIDRERLLIEDRRQSYEGIREAPDGSLEGTLTVRALGPPEVRPALGEGVPEEVQPFLESTATIQSDDPRFVKIAEDLAGDETDPWIVACDIAEWVDRTMTPDMNEPLLRSSLEVLEEPRGACRSYAALMCGVARAAGIPCRIAVGALYVDEVLAGDAFAFHAWNEVWVGEWVAIDATLAVPGVRQPADATHIKFTEGDVRAFVPVGRVVRSVGIEVLDTDTMEKADAGAEANQGEVVTE